MGDMMIDKARQGRCAALRAIRTKFHAAIADYSPENIFADLDLDWGRDDTNVVAFRTLPVSASVQLRGRAQH